MNSHSFTCSQEGPVVNKQTADGSDKSPDISPTPENSLFNLLPPKEKTDKIANGGDTGSSKADCYV